MALRKNGVVALFVCLLAACGSHEAPEWPTIRESPSPKDGIRVLLEVPDKQLSIERVWFEATYSIHNAKVCAPRDYSRALGGLVPDFKRSMQRSAHQEEDGTFTATFMGDAFLDEDYYGMGTCFWKLIAIHAHLHARSPETTSISEGSISVGNREETNSAVGFCFRPGVRVRQVHLMGLCLGSAELEKSPDHFKVLLRAFKDGAG